uniref:Pterin-binding domain-containing protein n=1 Tax=Aegilops tauschii subsp. strangulata TaxID=200361 RepID=A0A453C381_AEGTS
GGNFPVPNVPSWVKLLVGVFFAAVPLYRQMRALEDKVEQTAEVAIEVVEKVAEAAEKIADDVSEAFPGNDNLKKAASRIKTVADAIEEDAEKAEALIHKVDEITKEVDSVVGPIIDVVMKESGERGVIDEPKRKEMD